MKASILMLVAIYGMGSSVAFADGSQATNDKRGPAGIAVRERLLAARSKLIKQGWKPTRMHTSDGYEYSGVERELAARNSWNSISALLIARAASCSIQRKEPACASTPLVKNSMT